MKIISRDDAISQGLKTYFTGKPCKRNHVCERHVIGRNCVECKRNADLSYAKSRAKAKGELIPPFDGTVISRAEAISRGFKYYFTGKVCKNGHMAFRGVTNANCIHCEMSYELSEKQREKVRKRAKEWVRRNQERSREIKRDWVEKNEHKVKKIRERSNQKRNKSRKLLRSIGDSAFLSQRAFHDITRRVYKLTGKKKKLKTSKILGYTAFDLKQRIEFQFKDGMSWGNYGEWHIDHRKPISRFIKQGITDPKIINALSNLQPLWAKDNLEKSDKWIYG